MYKRRHYGLGKGEYIIFDATGNWSDQLDHAYDRKVRATHLKFFLLSVGYGLGICLLTFFVLTGLDYSAGSSSLRAVKILLTFFFMFFPFIMLWVSIRRPLFGIRYFISNKTLGYCYTLFNIISLEPRLYPLSGCIFIAPLISITYNMNLLVDVAYWRSDKSRRIFLSGELYLAGNEKNVIPMNLNTPQALAFVHILRCVSEKTGLGSYVNEVNFEGGLQSPDRIFLDKPAMNAATVTDYYRLWAMTDYVQNMPADDRYWQLREICAFFFPDLVSEKIDNDMSRKIESLLAAGEKYVFAGRTSALINKKLFVLTNQRIFITDDDLNINKTLPFGEMTKIKEISRRHIEFHASAEGLYPSDNLRLSPSVATRCTAAAGRWFKRLRREGALSPPRLNREGKIAVLHGNCWPVVFYAATIEHITGKQVEPCKGHLANTPTSDSSIKAKIK